jgi:cyclopropane fatty-acyl-phospholipid synthase-like methyltransferase
MSSLFSALAIACLLGASAGAPEQPETPAETAARLENASSAAFRYRAAIAGLLQLKPGMVVAEVGAVSGFMARAMAPQVGPGGRVVAITIDPRMAAYITERGRAEGIANLSAAIAQPDATGLEAGSIDAAVVVNAFSAFTRQAGMLQSIAAALKPGGALLIVDLPREGIGPSQVGMDADDLVKLAAGAGFKREAESSVVPGQYAIRFRKP